MKITPVLVVPSIEPVLPLWEALGFVILDREGVEVMYQTEESVRADEPRVLERGAGPGMLFIQVENLDATVARLPPGTDVFVERRTTFYGATETFLRDAAGNVIVFAQFA